MARGSGGPRTREWKLDVLQKELLKGEHLKKGIPEEELRRGMLAVGGKDVKAAN